MYSLNVRVRSGTLQHRKEGTETLTHEYASRLNARQILVALLRSRVLMHAVQLRSSPRCEWFGSKSENCFRKHTRGFYRARPACEQESNCELRPNCDSWTLIISVWFADHPQNRKWFSYRLCSISLARLPLEPNFALVFQPPPLPRLCRPFCKCSISKNLSM